MSPAPGFPVPPPPNGMVPQAHAPGGGQGLHYHTPRAPPTTTNVAATTDYCCCCCGYCCCYYYDYYILCLFLLPLPLLLSLLNPTMYVHMYAPTTGHRGGRIPWRGGEGGTSEAWLIYIYIYTEDLGVVGSMPKYAKIHFPISYA